MTDLKTVKDSFHGLMLGHELDIKNDGPNGKKLIVYKSDGGANHYGPSYTPVVEFSFVDDKLVGARLV